MTEVILIFHLLVFFIFACVLMVRTKKAQINIEKLTTELAQERRRVQKLEYNGMLLERQNKELKAKLSEIETSQGAKTV